MNKHLLACCFIVAIGSMLVTLPEGASAILLTTFFSVLVVLVIRKVEPENGFMINIFLGALIVRIVFGTILHAYDLRFFFGGDATTYDSFGFHLSEIWAGRAPADDWFGLRVSAMSGSGWGMNYLTAVIYTVFGRNILAAQFFCAVFGAATAPMMYVCANKMFNNQRVGRTSAFLVAFFPAFIIWSSQLLKDGLIIFLLVVAMTMVIQLQEKFKYSAVFILVIAMFGIIALRFYIFYMVGISVVGSFVIGTSGSVKSTVRGIAALIAIGLALTYLGVLRNTGKEFTEFGNLERVQKSRQNLSESDSGFGKELDVSTTDGALTAIPIGFIYLMLAPFPWAVSNLRQGITLPDILLWWSCIPLLISGLWFTIKNRLRNAISMLIFTILLTLVYSIFQGNVGTAYRQRAQIQVFLFIFIAVGWSLYKEKKEIAKIKHVQQRSQIVG